MYVFPGAALITNMGCFFHVCPNANVLMLMLEGIHMYVVLRLTGGDCTIGYVHLDVDVGADMGFADRLTTYPTIKIETGAISNLM